jgi:hypothetical protein
MKLFQSVGMIERGGRDTGSRWQCHLGVTFYNGHNDPKRFPSLHRRSDC